jgi:hypothetical protein
VRRHPNWRIAERLLADVIPGSTALDPDHIPGLTPDSWAEFVIDGRDPAAVTRELLEYCAPVVSGPLTIATLRSFRPDVGPFFVDADSLSEFVADYAEVYDDVPVAGDVVVVSPETAAVVVVHHNGLIATLHGPGGPYKSK